MLDMFTRTVCNPGVMALLGIDKYDESIWAFSLTSLSSKYTLTRSGSTFFTGKYDKAINKSWRNTLSPGFGLIITTSGVNPSISKSRISSD